MTLETLLLQKWLAALELADTWGFKHTRQLSIEAIRELPMSEVERISMIQTYGINEWAGPAYEKLLTRDQPLTTDEMKLLGHAFSSTMAAARERLGKVLQNASQCYCNTCKRYVQPHHL